MEDTNRKDNTYCCVPQCKSKGTDSSLSFHKFPDVKSTLTVTRLGSPQVFSRRSEWIRVLKIGKKVSHRMSVCSLHFQKTDYLYPSLPRKRKHLKKTAVPSLNLPVSSMNGEIFAKEDKLARKKQRKSISLNKKRFNKEQTAAWVRVVNRKNWKSSRSSILCSELCDESQMDRMSLSCVRLQANAIPTTFKTSTTFLQNTPAAVLENCSQKETVLFLETEKEGVFAHPGCVTVLQRSNPSRADADSVQVTEPTFEKVKSSSKKSLLKRLTALHHEIASLKTYAKLLQLQHVKLVEEQQSSLIKNVHSIRQDAVEGDLTAIVLLNCIVSYTQEH